MLNIEEKINILEEYKDLEDRVNFLRDSLLGVQGVSFDRIPTTARVSIEEKLTKIEKLENKMNFIKRAIDKLKLNESNVLEYVYIKKYSINYIASTNIMHYSKNALWKIYEKALENIDLEGY